MYIKATYKQTDDKLAIKFVTAGIPSNIMDHDYFRKNIKLVGSLVPPKKYRQEKFVHDIFLPKETARKIETNAKMHVAYVLLRDSSFSSLVGTFGQVSRPVG